MRRTITRLIAVFVVIIMVIGPATASPSFFDDGGPSRDAGATLTGVRAGPVPMDSSRAIIVSRLTGTPPTIDGSYTNAAEWSEATHQSVGLGADVVEAYFAADGERLYVLVDIVDDTDIDTEPAAPNCAELTVMIWDGNNDQAITFQNGAPGSSSISNGGQNSDYGVIFWGTGEIWNSSVTRSGNSIIFDTIATTNSHVETGFGSTPNSGTAHRVLEYMIPYDGPLDELGCSIGHPFTKRFNLQSIENASGTQDIIGQWPGDLTSLSTSFDTINLPQKYPHILEVVSPQENSVFQVGEDIKFEVDATDDTMSTLNFTLYIDTSPINMFHSNVLTKGDLPIGSYNISFEIKDEEGYTDSRDLGRIDVVEAAEPPVIEAYDPTENSLQINEGEDKTFTVDWYDQNLDQSNESVTVNWTSNGQPVNLAWIGKTSKNVTHHTSTLTFKADYTMAGYYNVRLELTDKYFGTYDSADVSWELKVNNVNRRPTIYNTMPEPTTKVTISEKDTKDFQIQTSDPDGDTLTVQWYVNDVEQTAFKNMNMFTFNSNAPDYELAGDHVVKVVATDGELSVDVQWNVTVTNVNLMPEFSVLTPTDSDIEMDEGDTFTFSFTATDQDLDALEYKWYVNDVMKTTGTGDSASFEFTASFLKSEGYDSSSSPHFVKVSVTDGAEEIENEWRIEVGNVNRPPIPVIDRPLDGATVMVNEKVNFKTTASSDPDGNTLTYTWDFGDRQTGVGFEIDHVYSKSGRYTVTLKASDGMAENSTTIEVVVVIPILELVDLTFTPSEIKEGEVLSVTATVRNVGDVVATNVVVQFYVQTKTGKPKEVVIESIAVDGTATANYSWPAVKGNQRIYAIIEESDEYLTQGQTERSFLVSVKALPTEPGGGGLPMELLLIILVIVIVIIVVVAAVAASRRKKRMEAEEDAKIKAIMDAKHAPPPKHKVEEPSPFDKTDFQFGGPVVAEERPCQVCGKVTTNPTGLCNICTYKKKKREEEERMMDCPVCGNEVSKDMFTCPYCHFNFTKMDTDEEEVEEERPEAIGYVSDDSCSSCGVMFNDGMTVLKCPSCEARYHTRCASRLGTCAECNGTLSAGMKMTFEVPKPVDYRPEEEEAVAEKEEVAVEKAPPPPPPKVEEEAKVETTAATAEGKCPSCGEEIEPDWKVCPSCDTKLGPPAPKPSPPPKVEVKEKESPKEEEMVEKEEVAAPIDKCPACGEPVEDGWKVCPACDARLVPEEEPKKKRITWSKRAKEKAKVAEKEEKGPAESKAVEKKVVEKQEEKKVDEGEGLKADIEALEKDIEKAEEEGKNIKKAKSLATLAGSFLKGKKPDKAKIYIDRARKELEK